jgi:hypothetical protein
MKLTTFVLLLIFQASEPRPPITIRCDIDTELPITEIEVSLQEKRELSETPKALENGGGTVTLSELPSGDLHLLFFRGSSLLGKVEVPSAEKGELIRIKVRLVEGNAILLDEFRVRGVSGTAGSSEDTKSSKKESESRSIKVYPLSSSPSQPKTPSTSHCPDTGEPMTLRGKMVRVIDNDSFEMQSGPWTYIVYVGTATHIHRGGTVLALADIAENQALTVKGTVAAGPEGECSIGAKDVDLR